MGAAVLVLGTIFIGLATPTEGGAMGASGALILALIKRRLTWDLTRQAAEVKANGSRAPHRTYSRRCESCKLASDNGERLR